MRLHTQRYVPSHDTDLNSAIIIRPYLNIPQLRRRSSMARSGVDRRHSISGKSQPACRPSTCPIATMSLHPMLQIISYEQLYRQKLHRNRSNAVRRRRRIGLVESMEIFCQRFPCEEKAGSADKALFSRKAATSHHK
jgi:hypothetical protein